MKEAYVSFETAKLLKEKGFDCDCTSHFDSNHKERSNTPMNFNSTKYWLSRPTHQMACAWLRERNIGIIPEIHTTRNPKDSFWSAIMFHLDKSWDVIHYVSAPGKSISEGYDDVVEQAIKYSLENLI